jgi:hypothetical protein
MRAQAAEFLRVCRGEADPPTGAAEAAEDLHLVSDMVRMRLELPGARAALHAEREARGRMWEERASAMKSRRR